MGRPVIAVEGIIAAGKTTVCRELGCYFDAQICYEDADSPRFREALQRYYAKPKTNALEFQLFVLERRSLQMLWAMHEARQGEFGQVVLQDRSLAGDRVFATLHRNLGNMCFAEWRLYCALWERAVGSVSAPDVLVFLDIDPEAARERMRQRGRRPEVAGVSLDYLKRQRDAYEGLLEDLAMGTHPWGRVPVLRVPAVPSICTLGLAWHLWGVINSAGYSVRPFAQQAEIATTPQISELPSTSIRLASVAASVG